ncbi:hypothetical protein BME96_08910 [Virgibacillus halodenitrificans]|uniref:Uncharacterized protein n=1 Tax=Virgibacillus halodenitrificans TaxID=1482 RepID=A0AAC9NL50_VIRHA|nr:hypothetical protein [Virgibacillus halodenitrificans]APC48281.1 hypothetical protein BME96_08910 [Virgibacillus halodenitrificans]
MNWEILSTLAIGALIPMITTWLTSKSKFFYDEKIQKKQLFRKEIRNYYIIKPALGNSFFSMLNLINDKLYTDDYYDHLANDADILEHVNYEDVPIEIFEEYYECIGLLKAVVNSKGVINSKQYSKHLKKSVEEVYEDTIKKISILESNYEGYIQSIREKI